MTQADARIRCRDSMSAAEAGSTIDRFWFAFEMDKIIQHIQLPKLNVSARSDRPLYLDETDFPRAVRASISAGKSRTSIGPCVNAHAKAP